MTKSHYFHPKLAEERAQFNTANIEAFLGLAQRISPFDSLLRLVTVSRKIKRNNLAFNFCFLMRRYRIFQWVLSSRFGPGVSLVTGEFLRW